MAGRINDAEAEKQIKSRSATAVNVMDQTTGETNPIGTNQHSEGVQIAQAQKDRAASNGISLRTQIKADYVARERADLKALIQAEQMSITAAYNEAKGKVKPTIVEQATCGVYPLIRLTM